MHFIRNLQDWLRTRIPIGLPLQIEVTNACNLRCSHCYLPDHHNADALDLSSWLGVLGAFFSLCRSLRRSPILAISGGEPLLFRPLTKLIAFARKHNPRMEIIVLSNGTILTDKTIETLKIYDVSLQVSFDGANETTHDAIRGRASFEKTRAAATKAADRGIKVDINVILSKRTVPHIRALYQLSKSIGASRLKFTRYIATGHAKDAKQLLLEPNELRAAFSSILACSKEYSIPTNTDLPLLHLIDSKFGASMGAGHAITITHQGDVKVTPKSEFVVANIKNKSLEDIFLRDNFFRKLRNPKAFECYECRYFRNCGGGDKNVVFSETGSFFSKDPGCWL